MTFRAKEGGVPGAFEARVSAYNTPYPIGWGWSEVIESGCFGESIDAHGGKVSVMYQHAWELGPIGIGEPDEQKDELIVAGNIYVGMDPLVDRVYQNMLDGGLTEWSVAFWPEEILNTKDEPLCDHIVKGDLGEVSSCIRGANPNTGTLYIEGEEDERKREVARLRSKFGVPVLGDVRHRTDDPADPATDAKLAARVERAMGTPWGRELVAAHRSSRRTS
jgi:HK97 family phage prohead protease